MVIPLRDIALNLTADSPDDDDGVHDDDELLLLLVSRPDSE